jgi:very-short-patch-repair endonuclease
MKPYLVRSPGPHEWLPKLGDPPGIRVVSNAKLVLASILLISFLALPIAFFSGVGAFLLTLAVTVLSGGLLVMIQPTVELLLEVFGITLKIEARMRRVRRRCTPSDPAGPCDSPADELLAEAFACAGILVHPQQVVHNKYEAGYEYKTDFAYYEPLCGLRVDIEVDGAFKEQDLDLQARMSERDERFVSLGWHVLRFHAKDCFSDAPGCAASTQLLIRQWSRQHASHLTKLFGKRWREVS